MANISVVRASNNYTQSDIRGFNLNNTSYANIGKYKFKRFSSPDGTKKVCSHQSWVILFQERFPASACVESLGSLFPVPPELDSLSRERPGTCILSRRSRACWHTWHAAAAARGDESQEPHLDCMAVLGSSTGVSRGGRRSWGSDAGLARFPPEGSCDQARRRGLGESPGKQPGCPKRLNMGSPIKCFTSG